jgi:LysM repeat protein
MSLFSVAWRGFFLLLAAVSLSGCFQAGSGPADEERDPYYLAGKGRVSSMDYDGAISAFESALTSNPKSAAAHFELGVLYEERKTNYARAIYHYEKHLELNPDSNMAESITQRIVSCKVELARSVAFALVSRQVQEEIRKLNSTNLLLSTQVEALKADLVQQANAYSNRLAAASHVSFPNPPQNAIEPERRPSPVERQATPVGSTTVVRATTLPRSHVVRAGETMATIARKYNLKLTSLQLANPGVDARRLKAGQVLNLPSARL